MSGGERPRPAEVVLVLACFLGVVVAVAAVPGVAGPTAEESGDAADGRSGSGTVTTPGDGGGGGSGGVGIGEILRWLVGEGDDGPRERTPPAYDVRVTPDPVPGRTVTVTVSRRGAPVEGARVAFGERPVGRTDANGQVRGRVPYADGELVVRVRPPAETARASSIPDGSTLAPPAALGGGGLVRQATPTPTNVTERYGLPTAASVRVVGETDPGATVQVVARVAGDPLPRAAVRVNGERVGRTDANGTFALRVPDDGTRRLRVAVERGVVRGQRTVPVRVLTLQVSPDDPVAVPTRPATVTARVGAEPASNASVAVAGERVGRTGADGRSRVTLPSDPTATVVVRRGDRVARRSLLIAYATAGVVLAVPTVALLAALGAAVRYRERVGGAVRRAGSGAVRLAGWVARVTARVARWLGRVAAALASGSLRLARWLAGVPRRVVAWASPETALALLLAGPRWLRGLPGRAVGWIRDSGGSETTEGPTRGGRAPDTDPSEFETLWRAFARTVVPDAWRHRTPAEVGRAAVERGLPAAPVERVTRAFRERAYARSDPSADERERAVETLRALLTETEEEP